MQQHYVRCPHSNQQSLFSQELVVSQTRISCTFTWCSDQQLIGFVIHFTSSSSGTIVNRGTNKTTGWKAKFTKNILNHEVHRSFQGTLLCCKSHVSWWPAKNTWYSNQGQLYTRNTFVVFLVLWVLQMLRRFFSHLNNSLEKLLQW